MNVSHIAKAWFRTTRGGVPTVAVMSANHQEAHMAKVFSRTRQVPKVGCIMSGLESVRSVASCGLLVRAVESRTRGVEGKGWLIE
jgi:hypothetical protein